MQLLMYPNFKSSQKTNQAIETIVSWYDIKFSFALKTQAKTNEEKN